MTINAKFILILLLCLIGSTSYCQNKAESITSDNVNWESLIRNAGKTGKPEWRPMLKYVAELHKRSTHPAIFLTANPISTVGKNDPKFELRESQSGMGESLTPIVSAGKNLTRTPAIMIGFGKGKGKLIVSQLLTAGRLAKGFGLK